MHLPPEVTDGWIYQKFGVVGFMVAVIFATILSFTIFGAIIPKVPRR